MSKTTGLCSEEGAEMKIPEGQKAMKRRKVVPVRFWGNGIFGRSFEDPLWHRPEQLVGENPYHCASPRCGLYITSNCKACKDRRYAIVSYDDFVTVYITLRRWGLPKDIVRLIVKEYVILSKESIGLTCPRGLSESGSCYHVHCAERLGVSTWIRLNKVDVEVALFNFSNT